MAGEVRLERPRGAARPGRGRSGAAARPESRPARACGGDVARRHVQGSATTGISYTGASPRMSGSSATRSAGRARSGPSPAVAPDGHRHGRGPRHPRAAVAPRPVDWSCSREPSTSSAKWQATSWPGRQLAQGRDLGRAALSGLPSRSRSQQRVWKWQPDGGFAGRRHVALEDDPPPAAPPPRGSGIGHRRQERHRVRVERLAC